MDALGFVIDSASSPCNACARIRDLGLPHALFKWDGCLFSTNLTAVGHASLGITSTISGCASVLMVFTSVPLAAEYCRRQLPNVFVDWITTTITSTIAAAIIAVGGADISLYSQGLATSLLIGLDAAVVVSFQSFKASVDIFSPGEVQDLFPLLDNQGLSEDL